MKTKKEIFHLYFKSEPSTRADRILYVITVIISMILLAGGYSFAVHGGTVLGQNLGGIQSEEYRARITEVISSNRYLLPVFRLDCRTQDRPVMQPCSAARMKENRFL